jgi:pimeloyl-ACP methyl ester carboxylesterase
VDPLCLSCQIGAWTFSASMTHADTDEWRAALFDVDGASLVPEGPTMREKPTLLLLRSGPGFDHSIYKPAYSALADLAQVIYLDHRGNGRSDAGPEDAWTLAQWGDDVRTFCDALGIERPIVLDASQTIARAHAANTRIEGCFG